jgi:TRAP-type uncharacterized transport system substrate-binding protein
MVTAARPRLWRGKGLARLLLFLLAAALVAALATSFGIAHDYGYLRASLLTGTPGGHYHSLARRLADRAAREHGRLTVVATAGSVENVTRLVDGRARCAGSFALVQDGTPVPFDARLELMGRLPDPESVILLARRGRSLRTFDDLRGLSVGIGPEGSGTAYLLRRLFEDDDLRGLDMRLSVHSLAEQADLVARGRLDLAGFVMHDGAEFMRNLIRQHDLDIVAPRDLEGLVARHPWLGVGRIPAGRYALVRPTPAENKLVPRVDTLVVASPCARRAERVALLALLTAELPGFVRSNPPPGRTEGLPLAAEARQFFLTGEPDLADRYFPWLVNLMAPAYWVYLVMAATILFNALKGLSRFRLWRIDAARERLEARLEQLVGPGLTRAQIRALPPERLPVSPEARATVERLLQDFAGLRGRCQKHVASLATPMGDEMFYRYQEHLVEESMTTLAGLLERPAVAASR